MKILFVTHDNLGLEGGPQTHSLALIKNWERLGHQVCVAAPVTGKWNGSGKFHSCGSWNYRSEHPVVGFFHLFLILLRLTISLRNLSKDTDLIYARDHFAGALASYKILNRGRPVVREINGFAEWERGLRVSGLLSYCYRWLVRIADKRSLNICATRIFVSKGLLESMTKELNLKDFPSYVVENGVNLSRFVVSSEIRDKIREQLGWSETRIITFVGSLSRWHGVETLIRSIEYLPHDPNPFGILIVGDGPERIELEELAKSIGVSDKIKWVGRVLATQVPEYLAATDICVSCHVPGLLGSPLKIREYLAAGRPVVQSAIEDTYFISEHNLGSRYTPGDSKELAEKLKELINDKNLDQINKRARNYAETHLSWEIAVERVSKICEQVIKNRSS